MVSTVLVLGFVIISEVQSRSLDDQFEIVSRDKRHLTYTYNSAVGMFLAFAVPLVLDERDIVFSYNFEANYNLPTNASMYDLTPPDRSFLQNINRTFIYTLLERRFNGFGEVGRQCLLHTICEVSKWPLLHNGIIGHFVHLLFTPTSSADEGLKEEEEAEERGKNDFDCDIVYKCSRSFLNAISEFSET